MQSVAFRDKSGFRTRLSPALCDPRAVISLLCTPVTSGVTRKDNGFGVYTQNLSHTATEEFYANY